MSMCGARTRPGVHVTHAADHSCAVPGRGARCPRRDDVKRRIARRWTGRQAVSSEEAGHRSLLSTWWCHGRTRRADLRRRRGHTDSPSAFSLQLWSVCVLSSQHFSTARLVPSRRPPCVTRRGSACCLPASCCMPSAPRRQAEAVHRRKRTDILYTGVSSGPSYTDASMPLLFLSWVPSRQYVFRTRPEPCCRSGRGNALQTFNTRDSQPTCSATAKTKYPSLYLPIYIHIKV